MSGSHITVRGWGRITGIMELSGLSMLIVRFSVDFLLQALLIYILLLLCHFSSGEQIYGFWCRR